jgi:hypothetical protein
MSCKLIIYTNIINGLDYLEKILNVIKDESQSCEITNKNNFINLYISMYCDYGTIKRIIDHINTIKVEGDIKINKKIKIVDIDNKTYKADIDKIEINNDPFTIKNKDNNVSCPKKIIIKIYNNYFNEPSLINKIIYFILLISAFLTLNIYLLVINNFLNINLEIIDIMVFLTILFFFSSLFGYIYISLIKNDNDINYLMDLFDENKLYVMFTSFPIAVLLLIGSFDTSLNLINSISIIGNFMMYLIILLVNKKNNKLTNVNDKKFLDNKMWTILLVVMNILMGIFFTTFNNSKIGPIGILVSLLGLVVRQIINFTLQNIKPRVQNDYNYMCLAYLYNLFFGFIWLFSLTFIYGLFVIDKFKWSLYGNSLWIPILFSIFVSALRLLSFGNGHKFLLNSESVFGSVLNANGLLITCITVLITPLFDHTVINSVLTYCGIIPTVLSLYIMYDILNDFEILNWIQNKFRKHIIKPNTFEAIEDV